MEDTRSWDEKIRDFDSNENAIAMFGAYSVWVDNVDGKEIYFEGTHEVDTNVHFDLTEAIASALWGWMHFPHGRPV